MSQILDNLNPKQKQAVTAIDGPVLVIAGPGSGKTKCLTHRIVYLIQNQVKPQNILAVTFTNKAAEEMRDRVRQLLQLPGKYSAHHLPTIGTFHAVCLKILRQHIELLGYQKNFAIYDETDQLTLIKNSLTSLQINPAQFKPATVLNTISHAKDELIDTDTYQEQATEYFPQNIAKIYQHYQSSLKKTNAVDFDDIIMLTVQLFQKHRNVLADYQNLWQYILVDEGHDTNLSQYTLTNLLSEQHQNLWVIADPDQSIYSWRGADFRNILNFEKDYPKAQVIFLEQNYRSTQNILAASHHIIVKNQNRKEKKLWTENPAGHPIQIVATEDEKAEGDFLIAEIENLVRDGHKLADFTVLYRTNAQSRAIEEAFLKASFPYKLIGTVKFYDRKEIKDLLAYLKYLANPQDAVSLQRIINTPPRRLFRFTKLKNNFSEILSDPACQNFNALIASLRQKSKKLTLTQLIQEIISQTNYESYIRDGSDMGELRWENITELYTVTAGYDNLESSGALIKFLEEVALLSSPDEIDSQKDLINLMTLHCAKGLEFDVVFLVGCEEGVFPHIKSFLDPNQMEEERRLFYVGLTRARQKAYLSFAQKRRLYGSIMVNPPSRFIVDLPSELVEFNEFNL